MTAAAVTPLSSAVFAAITIALPHNTPLFFQLPSVLSDAASFTPPVMPPDFRFRRHACTPLITPFAMIISLSRQLATPHAAYASCLRRCWLIRFEIFMPLIAPMLTTLPRRFSGAMAGSILHANIFDFAAYGLS
jgi:hypothetical protein